jgi:porin
VQAQNRSIAAGLLAASLATGAWAQDRTPPEPDGTAAPSSTQAAAPGGAGSSAAVAKKQGATAQPVGTPGTYAIAKGVTLTATYIGEAAGNPSGGLKQGGAYSGQVFGGLDFDLATLAGLKGGTVHFAMVQRHGDSDSARFIGNNTSVQEIYGRQKLRLTLFTYQQKFFDGKVDIEVGRTGGNDAFLTSPLYCLFQSNAICGSPVYIFQVGNFTAFPASGWAGHGKVFLTDTIYLHVGAFAADPRNVAPDEVGFNLSTRTATGATIPAEIGYATTFANDRLPRHYAVGIIYDASRRADPYLDASGRPAILTGAPYRTEFGRSDVYALFDQMVWRPDQSSPRGLTLFGVAMFHASGRVEQDHSLELGAVQLGTLPGRDRDTIGLAINERRFSSLFVDNIAAARTLAGGTADIPREEVMVELNYGIEVSSAVRLTPNLQYVLNPDQASVPSRTTNIRNAFVAGARIAVDLSALATR